VVRVIHPNHLIVVPYQETDGGLAQLSCSFLYDQGYRMTQISYRLHLLNPTSNEMRLRFPNTQLEVFKAAGTPQGVGNS